MSVGSGIILILHSPPENNQYQNILTRAVPILTSDLVSEPRDHHTTSHHIIPPATTDPVTQN